VYPFVAWYMVYYKRTRSQDLVPGAATSRSASL
jgi:hypothetical protein